MMEVQRNASFVIQVQCTITDDKLRLKNVSSIQVYTDIYCFPCGHFRCSQNTYDKNKWQEQQCISNKKYAQFPRFLCIPLEVKIIFL